MKQMIKHSYSTPATHGMVKREALAELQYKDDIRKLHKFAQNDKLVLKPIPDRYGDRYVSYWELQLHCWVSAYFDKISRTKGIGWPKGHRRPVYVPDNQGDGRSCPPNDITRA